MHPIRERLLELTRYGLVSLVAFATDLGLLMALVKFARWHYLPAAALSFICGGVVAYLLCIRFVFRYRRITNTTVELSSFVALGLAGMAVNLGVMSLIVEYAGLALPLGKLAASTCTFAANYWLRRVLLFTPAWRPRDR